MGKRKPKKQKQTLQQLIKSGQVIMNRYLHIIKKHGVVS